MKFTPAIRITVGILCLTISLVLIADFFGITPDGERAAVKQRQHFAEMLSIQMSLATEAKNLAAVQGLLWAAVKRNDEVISAAVKRPDGRIIAQYGEHQKKALDHSFSENNARTMALPVFSGKNPVGTIEILFHPLGLKNIAGISGGTLLSLIVFLVFFGGFSYWLLIHRSLMYLDPSAVVPDRVRSALDVLVNGVLILDEKGRIVLANSSFAKSVGVEPDQLIGNKPSRLPWKPSRYDRRQKTSGKESGDRRNDSPSSDRRKIKLIWDEVLSTGNAKQGQLLSLADRDQLERTYMVNCSPISDEKGHLKGAMIGFDDVTDIEEKNNSLQQMLEQLESSKLVVEEKNKELHLLATRDPLTNCFNRRSLYEKFEYALQHAIKSGEPIACIMADIDHFKLINDTLGHKAGDTVIVSIANVLREGVRDQDVVCRYGGEEFCILLPGLTGAEAEKIAERCRSKIENSPYNNRKITSSFGVSSLLAGAVTVEDLIDQADQALYVSKESGRNQVNTWSPKPQAASVS